MESKLEPNIAFVASLIADNARAKMLTALMSGKALTATELALEADITAQTASSHLSKLLDGELLIVRKQGRHKYFQLKNSYVAELIEKLLNVSATLVNERAKTGPQDPSLRKARVCYDHLAGEIGVVLFDSLIAREVLLERDGLVIVTQTGVDFFSQLGVDFDEINKSRRPLCKACLDWSERRSHLAGSLGKWILEQVIHKEWAKRVNDSRMISFSVCGMALFKKTYGIKIEHF